MRKEGVPDLADICGAEPGGSCTAEIEQLREALTTSREISTAVGIIMVRCETDAAGAFDILSQSSQRGNIKLRDLAARIVASESERHTRRREPVPRRATTPAAVRRGSALRAPGSALDKQE